MPRSIRLEHAGAFYHVMARGNRRETIFADEDDRRFFPQNPGRSLCHDRVARAWVGADGQPLSSPDRNAGAQPRRRDAMAAKYVHPALQRAAPALGTAL